MIADKSITTTWTALTTAGQTGSAWLKSISKGSDNIIVNHGASAPSASSTVGKRIFESQHNDDTLALIPDNPSDIFYARCVDAAGAAVITVDVA